MKIRKQKINTTFDLGPIFKAARKHKKFSLAYVASKAGFSYMTIFNIENNVGSTRTETLLAVATVLGVTVEVSVNLPKDLVLTPIEKELVA